MAIKKKALQASALDATYTIGDLPSWMDAHRGNDVRFGWDGTLWTATVFDLDGTTILYMSGSSADIGTALTDAINNSGL